MQPITTTSSQITTTYSINLPVDQSPTESTVKDSVDTDKVIQALTIDVLGFNLSQDTTVNPKFDINRLSSILSSKAIFCGVNTTTLKIHPKISSEHAQQTPFRLLHNLYNKILKTYPQDTIKGTVQALVYRAAVQVLYLEQQYINNLVKYIFASIEATNLKKQLFKISKPTWKGHQFTIDLPKFDLTNQESYAFYLRFIKRMEKKGGYLEEYESILSRSKDSNRLAIFKKFKEKDPNGEIGQLLFYYMQARYAIFQKKFECHLQLLSSTLPNINAAFSNSTMKATIQAVTPVLGFLACCGANDIVKIASDIDPDLDIASLIHQGQFCIGLLSSYIDKQNELYSTAYNNMHALLTANPGYRECADFEYVADEPDTLLPKPDAFKQILNTLKENIEELKDLLKPQSPTETSRDLDIDQTKKLQTPLQSQSNIKKKKRKKTPKKIIPSTPNTPASAATIPTEEKADDISQKTLNIFSSDFLKKTDTFTLHNRVRRWLTLDSSTVEIVRTFKDFRQNQIIYPYKDMETEQLQKHLLYHGFNRMVDKLLDDENMKNKYSYPTNRGYALFVEIKKDTSVQRGILFYGIDHQTKCCFHRMIEVRDNKEIIRHTMEELTTSTNLSSALESYEQEKQDSPIQDIGKQAPQEEIVTCDKFEILHFIDLRNNCQISVFPLN